MLASSLAATLRSGSYPKTSEPLLGVPRFGASTFGAAGSCWLVGESRVLSEEEAGVSLRAWLEGTTLISAFLKSAMSCQDEWIRPDSLWACASASLKL